MVTNRFVALACLALLCACGQAETPADLTEEDVAEELASVALEPGRWEMRTQIVSAGGPLPQGVIDRLVGRQTSGSACITPEQAERPNGTFLQAQQGADCAYHAFDVADGRLTAEMTCTGGNLPARMQTQMSGSYTSAGYDLLLDMRTTGSGEEGAVQIRTRSVGRRTGDC